MTLTFQGATVGLEINSVYSSTFTLFQRDSSVSCFLYLERTVFFFPSLFVTPIFSFYVPF